jgi:predicted ATPase
MFKLIAIQNHCPAERDIQNERRFASIYKILEKDTIFYFYNGYKVENGLITNRPQTIPFGGKLYSDGIPNIDICAVVGKNGSGKSSLIELYLRLVNNFAYVCQQAINDGGLLDRQFVSDIYSTAYFENTQSNKCYAIRQDGSKLSYLVNGEEQFSYNYNKSLETINRKHDEPPTSESAQQFLKDLCYTMVINYSAYSYNSNDYLPEWNTMYNDIANNERTDAERIEDKCWIDALFHKNDGYQLPIVLNPFRENGMVDYNNERELTQERLYHLTLGQLSPIDTILNGSKVDRYVFDVDDDLNPVGNKKYASYKVLSQMMILRIISDIKNGDSFNEADKLGDLIVTAWSKCFGVDLASYIVESKYDDGVKRNASVLQALNYIIYKTLKIPRIYLKYQFYNSKWSVATDIEELIKELYADGSHITLKIRRCIAYIIFRHYEIDVISVEMLRESIRQKFNKRGSLMNKARKSHPYDRFDKIKDYKWKENDFMPASSFKVNLYLKSISETGSGNISLSTMSSGERQCINSISTMAYHLSNIESVWKRLNLKSKEIAYENVCIIFDEMDLYLHPEYQTKMVKLILDVVNGLHLDGIKSIQIICATHSPFILSDILHSSILYLENGHPYSSCRKMKTFAANIGDLLCHSFFMSDGLIGRFSRGKIESLVKWLETEEDVKKTAWTDELVEQFVAIVDDPFVAIQLRQMLENYKHRKGFEYAEI